MVMTTSASLQASAADPTAVQPRSAARPSASSLRSKARTSCPALARFGAIPPPMCPKPMNAMRAILPSLPIAWPLLDEGRHAFLLVLGPEQPVEQAPFEPDALRKRDLEGGVDHLLDGDRGERRHGSDRFCRLHRFVEQLGRGHNLGDKAGTLRLSGIHHPPRQTHLHCLRLADGPSKALR